MTVPEDGLGAVALGAEDAARAVAAVKAQLRSGHAGEDGLIAGLCRTALGLAEQFTGSVMIAREMQAVLPPSPRWQRLAGCPVRAITLVEALAADGDATALASDAYAVDIDAVGDGWVRVGAGRVRVTYSAGITGDWDALPAPLAQGAVLLAAHLFDGRGSEAPPPAAVAALWRPWRRVRLDARRTA